mmetsp:Transcript_68742/g.222837  ORF Transcript_68742/g.222837 Transcript_68742/m.222837 type:complete len:225 (-) Transcript_68742:144-818(-)
MLVAAALFHPSAARAEGGDVNLYFGQGCFWHVQHDLIRLETEVLRRSAGKLTATVGYAGGQQLGPQNQVCYHNREGAPDYGKMGHAEVVGVSVPRSSVGRFLQYYFDAASKTPFGRNDPQDLGAEYRSVIGLPGGMDSPLVAEAEAASNGRIKMVRGQGDDGDTLMRREVYVYDSDTFPFHQAELWHQFHNDMLERYNDDYHQLKARFKANGKLEAVQCPDDAF